MNYYRWSQAAEGGVVAAVLAVLLAIILLPLAIDDPLGPLDDLHDSLALCVQVLLAAWAVLGPGKLWLRIISVPLLLAATWLLPGNNVVPEQDAASFVVGLVTFAVIWAAALRLRGNRVLRLALCGGSEAQFQFSLLSLLTATTCIALAVGSLEILRPRMVVDQVWLDPVVIDDKLLGPASEDPWVAADTIRVFVLSAFVSAVAVAGIFVVLARGQIWLRLALLTVAIPTLAVYLLHLIGVASELLRRTIEIAIGFALIAALTGLIVLPLRLFGYRLLRPVSRAVATGRPLAATSISLVESVQ